MASDIYYDAKRLFPTALSRRYVAHAHGTNTARDNHFVFRCQIKNRMIRTSLEEYRRTTALCVNSFGDSFFYVFEIA